MISMRVHKRLNAANGCMVLNLDIKIEKGELFTLFGESGAGKTSALRLLAGLLHPEKGEITVNEKTWFSSERKINLGPRERNIGFVFQNHALFPNMTVLQNLEFASKGGQRKTIDHLIELIELGGLKDKKPHILSGGQQQRVALARALVQQPEILLLDEPLSALDPTIRKKLQEYLAMVRKEYGTTTLLVSHDWEEILRLSDWAVELRNGQIVRQGRPNALFGHKDIKEDFKVTGKVLGIEPKGDNYQISLLVQHSIVKITAQKKEAGTLRLGETIIIAANGFAPAIYKSDSL